MKLIRNRPGRRRRHRPASLAAGLFAALILMGVSLPVLQQKAEIMTSSELDALLAKTGEYCAKLEAAALNFVCREEIRETIDPTFDVNMRQVYVTDWTGIPQKTWTARIVRKIKNTYVYDYQCIRAGRAIREVRTLLKENGRAKHDPNATLKTSIVVFGTALMGPVGLFGARFQPDYDFTIIGRDKVDKHPVIVIDARPKPGAPETRNLYGKAWVDPVTADILRIEWSESRVGRHEIFEKRAERYQRTPRLIIRSDFSAEKNGIRFPSRLTVEEAYVGKSGRGFVRSTTEVTYGDFKFFTVEVEVGL
jgi:hypothetical protein